MGLYYEEHIRMSEIIEVFSEVVSTDFSKLSSVLSAFQRTKLREDLGCEWEGGDDILVARNFSEHPEMYQKKWFTWKEKFDRVSQAKDQFREKILGVISDFKEVIVQIEGVG